MKMNRISMTAIIISVVNLIASVLYISRLPETVPTHFDVNWICDGVGSRWTALLTGVLPVLCALAVPITNKYVKERNQKPFRIIMFLLDIYLIVMNWTIMPTMHSGIGIGDKLEMTFVPWVIFISIGFLLVGTGNYFPVIQQNRNLGIRIKWTLENEQCWKLTHRFTGRLWVVTGVIYLSIILVSMLANLSVMLGMVLFFLIITVDIAAPIVYAYQHRIDA